MIESLEQLEKPGALRRAVADLGAVAAAPAGGVVDRLREMAAPEVLDLLFRLALESSLRRGPEGADEVGSPARLLDLAAAGAAAGAVPLWNVAALRDSLVSLETELHRSGAWDPAEPFWWSPLPPPGPLESAWRAIGERGWLDLSRLADPEGEGSRRIADAGWLARPDVLAPALRRRIAEELGAADRLDLEAAGVGGGDRRSSRRSDEVRYVTGLEADLLDRCPTLAALAQRLLHELEDATAELLPEGAAFAPQTAMLARYRAPCDGFAAHLDNPGGSDDNGRTFALVLYLNPPETACSGGDLALWAPETSTEEPAAAVLPPAGGSAVLFDARRVPHAVEPLDPGGDRWTMVVWTSDRRRRPPRPLLPVPAPTPTTVLGPLDDPPVAPATVVFRRIGEADGAVGPVIVRPSRAAGVLEPRVGFVTTARAPGPLLDAWCRHHLGLGAAHLLVVLDGDDEGPPEGAPADERTTVWPRADAAGRWSRLPAAEELDRLRGHAGQGRATWAVAARQALNASAARAAAAGGELGGEPLDWLVHLDADELFHLEGAGRGGASLGEHFAAADAAGWRAVRYLNHELLLPWSPGEPARFKRNPAVASARLGPVGWARLARYLGMEQEGARPYFRAYWNGKGAVSVPAGGWAAGVHGWRVPGAGKDGGSRGEAIIAGPSILHYHLPTAEAFRAKYRAAVAEEMEEKGAAERPFPPSHLEREADAILRQASAAGAGHDEVDARLDRLYVEHAVFSPREVELLEAAGLLVTPEIEHPPLPADGPAVSSSAV